MKNVLLILLLTFVASTLTAQKGFGFSYKANGKDSVLLIEVFEKGPAGKAEMMAGDILLSVNGITLTQKTQDELLKLFKEQPDAQNKFILRRGSKEFVFIINKAEASTYNFTCINGDCNSGICEIRFISGLTAKGNCKNGKLNGQVTFYYKDGSICYTGNVVDNQFDGQGEYTTPEGSRYTGNFLKDKIHGKGIYKYKNGYSYDGDWVNNKKEGKGVFTWPSGEKYEGEFKNDKRNGKGTNVYKDGRKYIGEWVNDVKEGNGTYTTATGDLYAGGFRNGTYHGNGTFTWANGDVYEGEFKDDKRNGKGTHRYNDGRKYTGNWMNDKKEGTGVFTWPDGAKYDGQWVNNLKEGTGTYSTANGEKYIGRFKNDSYNGNGILTWANGDMYEGEFKDDKRNGNGTHKYNDGNKYTGNWVSDKKEGTGLYTFKSGNYYNGEFKNNQQNGAGKYYNKATNTTTEGIWKDGDWENATTTNNQQNTFSGGSDYDNETGYTAPAVIEKNPQPINTDVNKKADIQSSASTISAYNTAIAKYTKEMSFYNQKINERNRISERSGEAAARVVSGSILRDAQNSLNQMRTILNTLLSDYGSQMSSSMRGKVEKMLKDTPTYIK